MRRTEVGSWSWSCDCESGCVFGLASSRESFSASAPTIGPVRVRQLCEAGEQQTWPRKSVTLVSVSSHSVCSH